MLKSKPETEILLTEFSNSGIRFSMSQIAQLIQDWYHLDLWYLKEKQAAASARQSLKRKRDAALIHWSGQARDTPGFRIASSILRVVNSIDLDPALSSENEEEVQAMKNIYG